MFAKLLLLSILFNLFIILLIY